MITANWRSLAVLSVTRPAEAAQQLMSLELSREVLWLALALAVVLNTTIHALSGLIFGPITMPLAGLPDSVVAYAALVGVGLLLTIFAIYRVGRMLGGQGSFDDVMVLMVWMQFLRVAVQAAALVLAMTIPILSALLVLAATFIGLFIFLHFIDQAHRLGSLMRAAGVMIASIFAIAISLLILLSLLGGPMTGASPYV